MSKYNFPPSPNDGDYFLQEDGFIYRYDAIRVGWKKLNRPIDYLKEVYLPHIPYTQGNPEDMIKSIIRKNLTRKD